MNAMNWVKGAVVAMGLSLGGSALAAGPFPGNDSAGHRPGNQHQRYDDRDWNEGWLHDGRDFMDRHERVLFRVGLSKVREGKALQLQGRDLLERSRWNRSGRFERRAYRLIQRGEALEREGRMLIWRARS